MRRDLFIPAATLTATVTTGLALIVRPAQVLYLAGSLIEAGWWLATTIVAPAFAAFLVLALLTDRDRKRRVRETRGVWR